MVFTSDVHYPKRDYVIDLFREDLEPIVSGRHNCLF